ncbi:MAG: hypothetical protein LBO00_10010 [Zoogloeaceae bacterium]|nr:hypothetical protein [Zoogloeaceae bacterium]
MGNADLLEYLRGNTAKEAPTGPYRNRNGKQMGDIINSAPLHVGPPAQANYGYGDYASIPEANKSSYSNRRTTSDQRASVVYVGANDGMLHAFNAGTGQLRQYQCALGSFGDQLGIWQPGRHHRPGFHRPPE